MKKKQYIIPRTSIMELQTKPLMQMASISDKGLYGAPVLRTQVF
jgi:hypothetical protein